MPRSLQGGWPDDRPAQRLSRWRAPRSLGNQHQTAALAFVPVCAEEAPPTKGQHVIVVQNSGRTQSLSFERLPIELVRRLSRDAVSEESPDKGHNKEENGTC